MRLVSVAFLLLVALVTVASAQTTAPLGPGSGGGPGGGGGGASPSGATGTVQYNAGGGLFGGITNWSTGGTNDLTGASGSTLAINGCTIGSYAMCTGGTSNLVGAVTLGTQQTTQGSLVLANTAAGAFATTLQSSNSATGAYTITLPVAAPGGNGYALTATTAGVGSWSNIVSSPCSAFGTTAGTCAQGGVITGGGPTGSATVAPIITYNAAGQLTTVSSATITPAIGSVTGLGTGVATLLGGNSSGTGGPAGTTSPSFTTPTLGVATATSLAIGAGSVITSSGAGGALGSNAFTSTAYAPLASPTFTGTVTFPDASTVTSSGFSGIGVGTAAVANRFTLNAGQVFDNGYIAMNWQSSGQLALASNAVFGYSATSGSAGGHAVIDTGLCRAAAGIFSVGSGPTCSTITQFKTSGLLIAGPQPTLSGSCSATSQVGGMAAGQFSASGSCVAGTFILTFAQAASNNYFCSVADITTPADIFQVTATSTVSVTVSGTAAASDRIMFQCSAF